MSYDDLKKQVVQAYSNLLIVQYHDKPKAAATIKMHAEMLLGDMIIWKLRDLCLNVDKSVGKQLDQIGQWVGVDRFINSSRYEGKMWLAYIDWLEEEEPNNLQGGLQDWNDIQPSTDGPILAYEDIISGKRRLTDDIFRILIKLKIIKNEIMHSPKYIDDAIFDLFNQDVYIEWFDKLFNASAFTVVGSPSITEYGVASGFSASDYLRIPTSNFIPSDKKWTINCGKIKTPNTFSSQQAIFTSIYGTGGRILTRIETNGTVLLAINYNGGWGAIGTSTIALNTNAEYYIRIKYTGSQYLLEYSINSNDDWISLVTLNYSSSLLNFAEISIGRYTVMAPYPFLGSIDLTQFSITVDGKEVFSGIKYLPMKMTYFYKSNKAGIMEVALDKGVLPCPSGVDLRIKEIEHGEVA